MLDFKEIESTGPLINWSFTNHFKVTYICGRKTNANRLIILNN